MQAKISKANRPKYFTCNGVCIRIDNIVFIQKETFNSGTNPCCVMVGIYSYQFQPMPIPCKDSNEQSAIFSELTTILTAL